MPSLKNVTSKGEEKKNKVAVSPKIYAQLWKNVMERERDKASNT